MSRLYVGSEGAESLPSCWSDEIVVHTMRRNRDGTLSIVGLVNVYADNGKVYSGETVMRLRKTSKRRLK